MRFGSRDDWCLTTSGLFWGVLFCNMIWLISRFLLSTSLLRRDRSLSLVSLLTSLFLRGLLEFDFLEDCESFLGVEQEELSLLLLLLLLTGCIGVTDLQLLALSTYWASGRRPACLLRYLSLHSAGVRLWNMGQVVCVKCDSNLPLRCPSELQPSTGHLRWIVCSSPSL